MITEIADTDAYPFDDIGSPEYGELVRRAKRDLETTGMFNLQGLMRAEAIETALEMLAPAMANDSFTHKRRHNIYFRRSVEGLAPDHPALKEVETVNHTLCADQLIGNPVTRLYEWGGLIRFLGDVMGKDSLFAMTDPLARVNVMEYREGEALNWHFDRAEFTTTLLLQSPKSGGAFEYRTDLRTADDPNYNGVAAVLNEQDPLVQNLTLTPGTLNVFKGVNTPHRVTTIQGDRPRIIAVFSYYDREGVRFTSQEQIGFYGRSA